MTVWVQTGDQPVSGTIVVRSSGMRGRSVRLHVPVAASANANVPIPIVAKFQGQIERVQITLLDEQGQRLAGIDYAWMPDKTQIQLPSMLISGDELVVSLTQRAQFEAVAKRWRSTGLGSPWSRPVYWRSQEDETPEAETVAGGKRVRRALDLLGRSASASLPAEAMPVSRMAYDGVLLVIADASTVRRAEPRAIAALQRWVIGGGRLVILADAPGSAWRRLVPAGGPLDSIHLGPVQQLATPKDLAVLPVSGARPTISGRPISLDLLARDMGWSVRWGADGSAMLAEGPIGFGWVTVVATHPDTVSPGGADANWTTWADAFSGGVVAASAVTTEARNFGSPQRYRYFGGDSIQSVAANIFDSISLAPPIRSSAYWLVGSVMLALAVAIGPLDYVLLGIYKIRRLTWLSALG